MSPNRGFCNIFVHSLFQNRSMTTFQIRNEPQPRILQHFCSFLISKSINDQFSNKEWSPCHDFYQAQRVSLLENSHLHEHRPHDAHSLLEKRPMTHFQRVNGGYKSWDGSWNRSWDRNRNLRSAGRPAGRPVVRTLPHGRENFSMHHLLPPTQIIRLTL